MIKGLISLSVLFIALVFAGVFVWPEYENLKEAQRENELKQQEFAKQREELENLRNRLEQLELDNSALSKVDQILPRSPDSAQIVYAIADAMAASGLAIDDISGVDVKSSDPRASLQQEQENNVVKELNVAVSATGDYLAVKNFVRAIESSARLFEIRNFDISSTQGNLFKFSANLITHSY